MTSYSYFEYLLSYTSVFLCGKFRWRRVLARLQRWARTGQTESGRRKRENH